ncbi:MAG TPA: hypothetical protein VME20_13150 [Acidimicrobiales bacterium]|nr:hypothetical protein [Acidimicrobiales bacterium]
MRNRALPPLASAAAISLALAGCGASVAAGGQNAATHPAAGIWVSPTTGPGNISGSPTPTVSYLPPANTPPKVSPPGLRATVSAVEAALTGGCWEDSHQGNVYGAYDQLFWWQGGCGDTVAMVAVELYPTVSGAEGAESHTSPDALLSRYRSGAVLVDVYADAPEAVLPQLNGVKGLSPVPGYES